MKLALLIFTAMCTLILVAIAGVQFIRLLFSEFREFIREAWHSPQADI